MSEHVGVVRQFVKVMDQKVGEAQAEKVKTNMIFGKVSEEDRDEIRRQLVALGEQMRTKYSLEIPQIRRFLHEILDVSV